MGCSSSREVRGGAAAPPAEQRPPQALRSRSLSRAASALASLAMCRGGHDGAVLAYARLPLLDESATRGAASDSCSATATATAEAQGKEKRHDAPGTIEDAASVTSSPAPQVRTLPDLDPAAVLPCFRQAAEVPSPSHPSLLYPEHETPAAQQEQEKAEETCDDDVAMGTPASRDIPAVTGIVRARVDEFHEKMEKKKMAAAAAAASDVEDVDLKTPKRRQPAAEATAKPVVLYFTSLRGVRRTFEDGRALRAILRCYRVRLDERDVSMHAAFRSELRGRLGDGFAGAPLPRVFLGERYDLGGADDVRALHEAGELARALAAAGCEAAPAGHVAACGACGEARFGVCETCRGSCKVFAADVDAGRRRLAGFFRRCPDCNENGLIRCPVCCY
ncbi:hypothetical protein ACP4OV_029364 [Aristida adscensionis]